MNFGGHKYSVYSTFHPKGFFIFKKKFFWLQPVLVVAHGIFVEAWRIFHCSTWALGCSTRASLWLWCVGFSFSICGVRAPGRLGSVVCGTQALSLRHASSVVVACQLSCPARGMWDLSSLTRDRTCIPCVGRRILYHWTTG